MKLPISKEVCDEGYVSIVDANGDPWFEGTGFGTEGQAADLIVRACNDHERLLQQIEVMKASTTDMQAALETASNKLDDAAKVQAQLVAALQRVLDEAVADDLDEWFANARAALAAAGITN
jgi:hypothetical protein